jgi:hypothetical protein
MDAKRFVAERLSLSQKGGAIQQQTVPLAGDQDSIPISQEKEPPKQVPLQEIPSPKPPPPVDPVCFEHFSPLIHQF